MLTGILAGWTESSNRGRHGSCGGAVAGAQRRLQSTQEAEAFEQELASQRLAIRLGISRGRGEVVRWNLRMKAAERGIWKATEMRGRLAEAGLEISHGKMSGLWTGTPITIRLDDLDVLCAVLDCSPAELLITEPDKVAARRSHKAETATASPPTPR
jgi:putative transcriptional regulator